MTFIVVPAARAPTSGKEASSASSSSSILRASSPSLILVVRSVCDRVPAENDIQNDSWAEKKRSEVKVNRLKYMIQGYDLSPPYAAKTGFMTLAVPPDLDGVGAWNWVSSSSPPSFTVESLLASMLVVVLVFPC